MSGKVNALQWCVFRGAKALEEMVEVKNKSGGIKFHPHLNAVISAVRDMVKHPREERAGLYTMYNDVFANKALFLAAGALTRCGWLAKTPGSMVGDGGSATLADTEVYKAMTALLFTWHLLQDEELMPLEEAVSLEVGCVPGVKRVEYRLSRLLWSSWV